MCTSWNTTPSSLADMCDFNMRTLGHQLSGLTSSQPASEIDGKNGCFRMFCHFFDWMCLSLPPLLVFRRFRSPFTARDLGDVQVEGAVQQRPLGSFRSWNVHLWKWCCSTNWFLKLDQGSQGLPPPTKPGVEDRISSTASDEAISHSPAASHVSTRPGPGCHERVRRAP